VGGTVALEGHSPATVELLSDGTRRRLRATLSDGQVLTADADTQWVWMTPISTLLAAYREAHPGVTREQAVQKIQTYLAVPDSLDRPFSSVPNTRFSPQAFLEAAGGRPLPEFAASLVPEIDSGLVHPFVQPQIRARGLFATIGLGFFKNVWEGGLMLSLTSKGIGALAGLCGLHSSTYKMLQEIQQQLAQIAQQATDIQTQLDSVQNQAALNTLKNNIATAVTNVTNYSNVQVLASASLVPDRGLSHGVDLHPLQHRQRLSVHHQPRGLVQRAQPERRAHRRHHDLRQLPGHRPGQQPGQPVHRLGRGLCQAVRQRRQQLCKLRQRNELAVLL